MKYSELPRHLQVLITKTGLPQREETDFLVPRCESFALSFAYLDRTLAQLWWEKQSSNQRSIAKDAAERYSHHMNSGEWELLPNASMVFDRKGEGANGKTTLRAFLDSGAEKLAMLVAFGVPPEALRVMDDVRKRTTVQCAKMYDQDEETWDHGFLKWAQKKQYEMGLNQLPKQVDALLLPKVRAYFNEALSGFSGVHATHTKALQREEWGLLLLAYYAAPKKVCELASALAVTSKNFEAGVVSDTSPNVGLYMLTRQRMKAAGSSGGSFDKRIIAMLTRVLRAELEDKVISKTQLEYGMGLSSKERREHMVIDFSQENSWLEKIVLPPLQKLAKQPSQLKLVSVPPPKPAKRAGEQSA